MSLLDKIRETLGLTPEEPAAPEGYEKVERQVRIEKFDDDLHVAFGWAYRSMAVEKDGTDLVEQVDHSGESIAIGDLEDAAYAFNLLYREGDEQHTEAVKAYLVESMVYTPEKLEKLATDEDGNVDADALAVLTKTFGHGWWTGWLIPDDAMWKRVREGELPMLSIGGLARRELVDA